MCGIAGVLVGPGAPRDQLTVEVARMGDQMASRGPDDSGVYASPDGRVALGNRRLAIQDISCAGHMPMTNEIGDVSGKHPDVTAPGTAE